VYILKVLGESIRDVVLGLASFLKVEAAPGLVTLALLLLLVAAIAVYVRAVLARRAALRWIAALVREAADGAAFSEGIANLDARIEQESNNGRRRQVAEAWREYRETFVPHDEDGVVILRNSVRPSVFFNAEDLGFTPGFWRILPGLFVTVGLFLTFLGLISALHSMDLGAGRVEASLKDLLTIASAKFIMSLTGLFCSIIFTIVLRWGMGRVDGAVHQLCSTIERRLTFISLEALAVEQLAAVREQREHFRRIGLELVAELGRPLREEVPAAISGSITAAMQPLLQQIGTAGTDSVQSMVQDLSSRFTTDVGRALETASRRLEEAGDKIGTLAGRMDQSSGTMSAKVDASVDRLVQAVDELRGAMGATAQTASGAFTEGANHLLAVMNQTLEGIRDNTRDGSQAISAAATDMRKAAEAFAAEIERAAESGSTAAKARMDAAGADVGAAIGAAGDTVRIAFEGSGARITEAAEAFAARAAQDLLQPLEAIVQQLGSMVQGLAEGAAGLRRLSDGVRSGAEATEQAAGSFRTASSDLVAAVVPIRAANERIEGAMRQLTESTGHVATTVSRSAETTAEAAARALESASTILGARASAIEASMNGVNALVERLKGQGDRMDDMDEKLGRAFEEYNRQVGAAVEGLFGHVRQLQNELDPALDTLRSVVEQAEQFAPQQRSA
jgi:hypothetical protein